MANKVISDLITKINKDFGLNAIRRASEIEEVQKRISTGSLSLDIDLGGGIPTGRMTQISGGFSACKSALAYHIAAEAQKIGKRKVLWAKHSTKEKPVYKWEYCNLTDKDAEPLVVALIQSENHSYSNDWAEQIGVDVEDILFVQPEGMEEGLEIASQLQQSGKVDFIIHDSYAAYKPIKELEKDQQETVQMGLKAKAFDEYHGKYQAFNNRLEREGNLPVTLIALNQLREKIGAYGD